MKNRRSRIGLSILTGSLSFVGATSAMDLITNGSFENAAGPEWKFYGTYATAYYTGALIPAEENAGPTYSWMHGSANGSWNNFVTPTNLTDHLQYNLQWADSQTVNLTNAITPAGIDSGLGQFTFSSWLASYGQPSSNPEQPFLVLRFFDGTGTNKLGTETIFDRTSNMHAVTYAHGNTSIPDDVSADHDMIKYSAAGTVPTGSRFATVYITRSPNAGLSGRPDTYVDLVKLDVINVNDTTVLDSATPANGQSNVSPEPLLAVTLKDVNTQVKQDSIKLSLDGASVIPAIQKVGAVTTVQYAPVSVLAPFVTHSYRISWSDTGVPTVTKTNDFSFSVAPYVNVNLGTPLYLETFDSVAEGTLPAGWSVVNYTDPDLPGLDLNNFHSDSYLDWVVISRSTMTNVTGVVPGGGDFLGTFNVAPNQVINGALVTNLIDTNFIFAASDRGPGDTQKQIQYLFTGDYNLSGKTSIYLAFNNIYVQNQDSMGCVEYSINGGTTWLPALYMLEGGDILTDASGAINASNTFAAIKPDVADIDAGTLTGGHYGRYIGVNSNLWSTLAPYLAARTDDDQTGSKRIEIIRLPQADNQPAVRLRFAQVALYSWYFGMDNVGLYSIPNAPAPVLTASPTPAVQTAAIGNSATITIGSPLGLGPFSYQWRQNGANLPGKTSPLLALPVVQAGNAGSYDVIVTGSGGSVTSAPPAVLTVIDPPVFVTGQWDFNGNLAATFGRDLEYSDSGVTADTTFGTTLSFGIADINGQSVPVMHFTPVANPWAGYKMYHGAAPNGGGAYVNQYTIIYDIFYPSTSSLWRSLLQTDTGNTSDGDLFFNPSGGLGISSVYEGFLAPDAWHRVTVAFDLTGPGQAPVLTKFIDGVKVGNQTGGLSNRDGRFALDPYALLFADNDGDVAEGYVSSIQFNNGRRPDAYLAGLGGPSAAKIPGAIKATKTGANVSISWTGGVPLESAPTVSGPWTVVPGATNPYTPPAGGTTFYRPKLF